MTDEQVEALYKLKTLMEGAGFEIRYRHKRLHPTLNTVKPGEEFILRRSGHRCLMLDVQDKYGGRLCWNYDENRSRSYTGTSEVIKQEK